MNNPQPFVVVGARTFPKSLPPLFPAGLLAASVPTDGPRRTDSNEPQTQPIGQIGSASRKSSLIYDPAPCSFFFAGAEARTVLAVRLFCPTVVFRVFVCVVVVHIHRRRSWTV